LLASRCIHDVVAHKPDKLGNLDMWGGIRSMNADTNGLFLPVPSSATWPCFAA
jgi:hypothetical protein